MANNRSHALSVIRLPDGRRCRFSVFGSRLALCQETPARRDQEPRCPLPRIFVCSLVWKKPIRLRPGF